MSDVEKLSAAGVPLDIVDAGAREMINELNASLVDFTTPIHLINSDHTVSPTSTYTLNNIDTTQYSRFVVYYKNTNGGIRSYVEVDVKAYKIMAQEFAYYPAYDGYWIGIKITDTSVEFTSAQAAKQIVVSGMIGYKIA